MRDDSERPFSVAWVLLSLVLFLGIELVIGHWLMPRVMGAYVSPMFHDQLQMLLHLLSLYLGGVTVGVLSPGRRLLEPAVGAFLSVLLVFLMSFFLPGWFWVFSLTKVLIGGGIGFGTALLGAWHGEKWMGNLPPDDVRSSARGRLRDTFWK